MRQDIIFMNQLQKISGLQKALESLEDRVILSSKRNIDQRLYAISELRYYRALLYSFFEYPLNLQVDIITDMIDMIEEVEKWLK